jgi:hypothetical protein
MFRFRGFEGFLIVLDRSTAIDGLQLERRVVGGITIRTVAGPASDFISELADPVAGR